MQMVPQHIVAVATPSTLENISSCKAHLPCATAQRNGEGDIQVHEYVSDTCMGKSCAGEAEKVDLLSSKKMLHAYEKCNAYSRTTFG